MSHLENTLLTILCQLCCGANLPHYDTINLQMRIRRQRSGSMARALHCPAAAETILSRKRTGAILQRDEDATFPECSLPMRSFHAVTFVVLVLALQHCLSLMPTAH